MTTAREIITTSLRKIHVLGKGVTLSSDEADDALGVLNGLLAFLSAEGAMVFQETKEDFTLVGNQASYTVAVGGDFNTIAPLYITASYVRQGDTDYPLMQFDEQEYSRIAQKNISGSVPEIFYYDANFPTANISFYPVPSSSDTFTMYSRKPLTAFTDLDTVFAMPEQYKPMLENNLSVWLAPEYEREASPTIKKIATTTKNAVIGQNNRNEKNLSQLSGIPAGGSAQYSDNNIYSGYFN